MVYGVGDGGGGPAEEHIERFQRIQNLDGLPQAKNGRVNAFFERVDSYRDKLPVMQGELYFEAHQAVLLPNLAPSRAIVIWSFCLDSWSP
ncbi:alpha-mannosidase [Vibrio ishigakensis]|uniref:Alpha-mannosidase n=1 Tax=Vibrio ishigakensis TaxID=1481914 RepID=A0A0B8NZV5_9VIBR|nr:alpha-mannosidase [Vibrio ishigakensis]